MEASGKRYIVHPSRSDEFTIWNITDTHIGNAGVAMGKLLADIEAIRNDPYSFWVGGGDFAEYISPTDPRFDPDCVDQQLKPRDFGKLGVVLTEKVASIFAPIKHKCIGLVFGNHEAKYMKHNNQSDLHGHLCSMLRVPNLGNCGFFDLVFVRNSRIKTPTMSLTDAATSHTRASFRGVIHHGVSGATSHIGKAKSLERAMGIFDADFYMLGHVHGQAIYPLVTIGANNDCTKIVERVRYGIISGTYLRTYTQGVCGYGEQKMYAPTLLGASFIRINPETRQMRAEA